MSRLFLLTKTLLALAATTFGVGAMFFVHGNESGDNQAMIFQGGPFGGHATIEVQQHDGLTIIKRRDANGNSTVIIQQK